ncbi:bifunctional helix-turn-helix transcriptional regulator/GNAT family N-acetyltransferase [Nereida sp. MMG025]|uniref:helix-turn-helix domain-containing GNAT family N-acetyltransferase n=1 Tax=Nereida sp. MMG025 TaxID=2909981 RepID=UPI001F23C7E1|nr:bifunctional helix-turn-helix transcriptional regulator/GNAT family N-acetyltransferase [Nereida sp. MMG025]MCF6445785.1 bifunctional helix-turn-helix transcriptional regulator/GNAT family N-acetyltransferase [Nereida sp. MMG025]
MITVSQIRRLSHQIETRFAHLEADASQGAVSTSGAQALALLQSAPLRASALGDALELEKSTVSRLVGGLLKADLVREMPDPKDGRAKLVQLTDTGRALAKATAAGLGGALDHQTSDAARSDALWGLACTARGLGMDVAHDLQITTGYSAGAMGRLIELHGTVYSAEQGLDQAFEAVVAKEFAELTPKLGGGKSQIWTAHLDGRCVGGICVDGDSLRLNRAEIRFFVLDPAARGLGLGKKLVKRAVNFHRSKGFDELSLRTFEGLDAARALYESVGFALVEEKQGDTYGRRMVEQKFVLQG